MTVPISGFKGSPDIWILEQEPDEDGLLVVTHEETGELEMKDAEDVVDWDVDVSTQGISPTYAPVSPTYTPVSPTYAPDSPTYAPGDAMPISPPPLNLSNDKLGQLVLWSGDPQPGRIWRISNIDQERHEANLIPGSFKGDDNIKVSFADLTDLPSKSKPESLDIEIPIDVKQDTPTGKGSEEDKTNSESWEPSEIMKERIKERGLEENFKKQQENKDGEDSKDSKETQNTIVIRTPVLDKDDSISLKHLANIESASDGSNKDDQETTGIKKLITKL